MRYVLQLIVMLSDILVLGTIALLLYSFPMNPIIWILCALCFWAWWDTGNLQAWNPRLVKQFLKNAKEVGL